MLNHPAWQDTDMTAQLAKQGFSTINGYRQELAMVEIQQTGKSMSNTVETLRDKGIEITDFKSKLFD